MGTDDEPRNVRIVQEGNWKYEGRVLQETTTHITITDRKTHRAVTVRKDSLLVLEEL